MKKIIDHLKLNRKNIIMGKSKVLYRAEEYRSMELDWSIVTRTENVAKEVKRLAFVDVSKMSEEEKEVYLGQLASTVREADSFRIHTKESDIARKRLEEFVEARMDPQTLKDLHDAKASADRDLLEKVLEVCRREGYITKLVRECAALLEKIDDATAALTVAKNGMKKEHLARAMKMAADIGFTKNQLYIDCQENLECLKYVNTIIQDANSSKPVFDFQALEECMNYVEDINRPEILNLQQVKSLRSLHAELRVSIADLDRCANMFESSSHEFDIQFVEQTLARCEQPNFLNSSFTCDDYVFVKGRLDHATSIVDDVEATFRGGPYYNYESMSPLKNEIDEYPYMSLLDECVAFNNLFNKVNAISAKLESLATSELWGDCEELKACLDECNEPNFHGTTFRGELYDICNSVYSRVSDINIRAKEIRVTLEEESVRELVEEAEEC